MRGEPIIKSAVVVLLWGLAVNVSAAKYSGGSGEPNDPYRIATPNDLNDIDNHIEDFNKCFVMVNDVNLGGYTGTQYNIIGDYSNPFTGVFDGNGHAIFNLSYNGDAADVGLFGRVECLGQGEPLIKDVTLIDPNVNAQSGHCAAALCGRLEGGLAGATVRGCKVAGGRISGGSDCSVGGVVGHNAGRIEKCYSTAEVCTGNCLGGLVGLNNVFEGTALISDCYSGGSVSGPARFMAGLVGYNGGTIENAYSCGQVAEDPNAGGFVGYDQVGFYSNCFWDSDINPDMNGIGNATDPNVAGKSTAEMMTESTFTNWDFVEVWGIGENQTYPFLRVYSAGDLNHSGLVDWQDIAVLAGNWLEETE